MSNSILQLRPYDDLGKWVFDDPAVGLRREPFVGNTNALIDLVVVESGLDLAACRKGFLLTFSAASFPGASHRFDWTRGGDGGGNYYRLAAVRSRGKWAARQSTEGWLCPALFKYFDEAPSALYAMAEAL